MRTSSQWLIPGYYELLKAAVLFINTSVHYNPIAMKSHVRYDYYNYDNF